MLSDFSRVRLCATLETAAHQAPPSLGFSRQEHWSGLPFPSPMHESEKGKWSRLVVSNPQRPHGLQPTRLLCPWGFPGRSTGVGCHCLLRPQPKSTNITTTNKCLRLPLWKTQFWICLPVSAPPPKIVIHEIIGTLCHFHVLRICLKSQWMITVNCSLRHQKLYPQKDRVLIVQALCKPQ